MLTKQVQFFGEEDGVIRARGIFSGVLEKTAGVAPFAEWATGDRLRKYISTITAEDRKKYCYVLVNALGAGEYFGSNINADYFPWNALAHEGEDYGYQTFLKAHAYAHHVNKDPTRAFGVPVLSVLNHPMKRVELIIRLDRAKAKQEGQDGIITRIDAGEFPDVSMGCKVPYDVCSICQNRSKTRADYCEHMQPTPEKRGIFGPNKILPDGRKIYVLNTLPRFFDISFVFIGADKTAKVMAKLASKGQQVCLGDICTIPRPSAEVAELADGEKVASELTAKGRHQIKDSNFVFPETESYPIHDEDHARNALARAAGKPEEAQVRAAVHRKYPGIGESEKTASACCTSCAETGGCCGGNDFDKLASAFGVKKLAAKRKLSEIIKSVPASPFALKGLPEMERCEPELPPEVLDRMSGFPLSDSLGTATGAGMLLRPREFQRIILIRMGERPLADELDRERMVFRETPRFDHSVGMGDDIVPQILRMIAPLLRDRTAFGEPFATRVIRIRMGQKPLPTDHPVEDPLLDKISAAYNGYRQEVLCKMAQAAEVVQSDPRLREMVLGESLSSVFAKQASEEVLLSRDSISYLAGAYLGNRGLLNTPVVAVRTAGIDLGFTDP